MGINRVLPFSGPTQSPSAQSRRTPRYLAVFFPAFQLERCGYLDCERVVLCAFRRNALRVIALMPAARAAGLSVGMSISEARALCPQVVLEMWCEEDEARDWASLMEVYRSYSDRIQGDEPRELVLEVSGTAHLFDGEDGIVRAVGERASSLGHLCRVGLADDPLAASVWARVGGGGAIPAGQTAAYLADLPFVALGPSESLHQAIRALDIDTIGQWAALDSAAVAGRYGLEGVRLHRVARGQVLCKGLSWSWPEAEVVERVELMEPARAWPLIEWALRGALERIVSHLVQRQQRLVQFRVHLLSECSRPTLVRVRVGRPLQRVDPLVRLCRHRMEAVRLAAPVVACLVEVEQTTPEGANQRDLLDRRQVGEELPEVVARLADGMGEETIFQPAERARWRPESAWYPLRFGETPTGVRALKKADPVAIQQGGVQWEPRPRPGALLVRPERMMVREQARRPSHIKWNGRWWPVERCEGPERLCVEWWKDDGGINREYWVVAFGGRLGWIFQDERANWALHGWFG